MLVVDDEPDNLDLLYRTFRRQFSVFKAESGIDALDVLKEQGEVAVIISDQRMPEMKGTEFLRRTVPDYPDTVRIILTGFTDVEDLVDAINAGQVYKYITKPWDPEKLKKVVDHAANSYEDQKRRSLEVMRSKAQMDLTATIFGALQGEQEILTTLPSAFKGRFLSDGCGIVTVQEGAASVVSSGGGDLSWLQADPMVAKAIAEGKTIVADSISRSEEWKDVEQYGSAGVAAQVVVPGMVGGQCAIALVLQWGYGVCFEPEEIKQMNLSAKQLALVVSSLS
ncbi:MAG: response regulator [Cyanobacteria bacterium P01_D01_bin.73]